MANLLNLKIHTPGVLRRIFAWSEPHDRDTKVRIGRSAFAARLGAVLLSLQLFLVTAPARADFVSDFEFGAGAAVGGAVYEVKPPAFFEISGMSSETSIESHFAASPLIFARWDPFSWSIRPIVGLATLPTFNYSLGYDASSAPYVVAELGLVLGSKHHHAALMGHAGLFSFGAGLDYTWLPIRMGETLRMGIDLRLMWMARTAGYFGAAWTIRLE